MPKAFSPQDHYFHLAKKKGYRARSAFKLEEILLKFSGILPKNASVIDLGAAPGSFLQVLSEHVGPQGRILGIDLQQIEPFPGKKNIYLFQGDIFEKNAEKEIQKLFPDKIDLITSDLAPKTSGIPDIDQWKSIELSERVLELAEKFLKPNGNIILKIFVGSDFQEFWKEKFQPLFKKTKSYKPLATRDRSFETYLVGERFRSD